MASQSNEGACRDRPPFPSEIHEATGDGCHPLFQRRPVLARTLESALNQSHAPIEVLVIDDGSTDQSAAIAASYGPPVRVISQTNQGESIARNRGIEEARGSWIAFLDADDIWLPEKLERQITAVQPGVACIHTNFLPFGTCHHVRDVSKVPAAKRYSLERLFLGRSPIRPSTLMVPKSLPARFPTWTRFAEDAIYFVEVCRLGKVVLVEDFLTAVRCHPASQMQGRALSRNGTKRSRNGCGGTSRALTVTGFARCGVRCSTDWCTKPSSALQGEWPGIPATPRLSGTICRRPRGAAVAGGQDSSPLVLRVLHRGLGKLWCRCQELWISGEPDRLVPERVSTPRASAQAAPRLASEGR